MCRVCKAQFHEMSQNEKMHFWGRCSKISLVLNSQLSAEAAWGRLNLWCQCYWFIEVLRLTVSTELHGSIIWLSSKARRHTNKNSKLLSKYILFWTFVSLIWQKWEQISVMQAAEKKQNKQNPLERRCRADMTPCGWRWHSSRLTQRLWPRYTQTDLMMAWPLRFF